jgi:hypothetical protein
VGHDEAGELMTTPTSNTNQPVLEAVPALAGFRPGPYFGTGEPVHIGFDLATGTPTTVGYTAVRPAAEPPVR